MQTLQVYIGETRLDLFSDESIDVTQSIQNIKDISKIFTDFSRSFNVPASKTNNKIFKHYNNKNIINGFDARKKVDAKLEINNKPFRDGKIKLDGVNLKEGVTASYKITFFGNTINLKDIVAEEKLETLDWLNNFTLNYSATQVKDALQNGKNFTFNEQVYPQAIVAPLLTNTTRLFYDSVDQYEAYPAPLGGNLYVQPTYNATTHSGVYYEELKYSIRIHLIIKAIEQEYGIVFSEDFFNVNNPEYYNLYMWLHRDRGFPFEGDSISTLVKPFTEGTRNRFKLYPDKLLVFDTDYGRKLNYNFSVTTNTAATFKVTIKKDGVTYNSTTVENGTTVQLDGRLQSSSTGYKVYIESDEVFTFTATWDIVDLLYPYEDGQYLVSSATNVGMNTIRSFIITDNIPNMRIIDFLNGLFKTFNLTAYQRDGVIIVDTLDDYYGASTHVWELDKHIDAKDEVVDNALPFQEIDFKYKGTKTFLAVKHTNSFSQEWGELRYTSEDGFNDASPNVYSVEIPFEHVKYERLLDNSNKASTDVLYGWFADDKGSAYLGEPLIFYPIQNSGTEIQFLNNENYVNENSRSLISTYFVPSNSLSLDSAVSTSNLNFYLQANEYTFTPAFSGTLFAKYYQTYIRNVFDIRNRLTKITAKLPLNFLLKFQLNDKIRFRGNYYKINSITSDLLTGKASLELINQYDYVETTIDIENGGEGGGEILPTPEGDKPCPLADTTFWTADSTDVTVDRDCNQPIPPPAPEPEPCNLTMFASTSVTTSNGLACGLSNTRSLWHNGSFTYPQVGDRIHADANCESFIADGYIKVTNENTTLEVLRTAPNLFSVVVSKTSCNTDFLPTVVTNSATADENSATLSGVVKNIGFQGYTVRGFYYILGTGSPLNGTRVEVSGTFSVDPFTAVVSGLQSGQAYSVVAFATNNVGTAYGNTVQFFTSTATSAPSVTTVSSTSVLTSSAVLNGNINDIGSPNYFEKGFYWVEGSGTPTDLDNIEYVGGTNSGAFNGTILGLNYSTLHSFRAFATNSVGTDLGATLQFTTPAPSCNGGSLTFTSGTLSGYNMSIETGAYPYTQCDSAYSVTWNLFNNDAEWTSTSQVTDITIFEGGTNVTSEFTITKTLSGGVIGIKLDSTTPTIFESSNRTFTMNVTAPPAVTYQTDITVTQSVSNSSLVVRNSSGAVVSPNSHTVIEGEGKAYSFTYTYTASSGYSFTGRGNIQNLNGNGVNVVFDSSTSSTLTVIISGVIGSTNQTANASWNGATVANPATTASVRFRYGTTGDFDVIPQGGVLVYSNFPIQVKVVPNGFYYASINNNSLFNSIDPISSPDGEETIHTLDTKVLTSGQGLLKTTFRVYNNLTSTDLANILFYYNG
jgi:hypothetical protein